jgi:glycosyltransferase involved in cell wall biosynthesis
MKVVHLSTSTAGGAGIAAIRLHKGLLAEGVSSKFLTLNNHFHVIPYTFNFPHKKYTLLEKVLGKFCPITKGHKNDRKIADIPRNYEVFTFPSSDYNVSNNPLVKEADVIHLHWVTNFLDYSTFFKKVEKPIVWTLHDMNPFQGGFHYNRDKVNSNEALRKLDKKLERWKKLSYQSSSIKNIVSPSLWLSEEASKSDLLGSYHHVQIPYGLDTKLFYPYNSAFAREVFQLPLKKKVFLFVAENIGNHRKGFDMIRDLIMSIKQAEDCLFVAVGNVPSSRVEGIKYLGPIRDERLMALAYSAVDAFILPSREDNLPNVMLESLSCGTPVIATPVGGMKDVIKDGQNGYLSKDLTSESLKIAVEKFIQNFDSFDRSKIRQEAEEKFSLKVQAQRYVQLYQDLLKEK